MEHWKLSTLNNAEHWIRRALDGSNAQFQLLVIEWCYWSHWPDKPPKLQMLNPSSTLNPPHSFVVNVGWHWTYWWTTCGYECFNDFNVEHTDNWTSLSLNLSRSNRANLVANANFFRWLRPKKLAWLLKSGSFFLRWTKHFLRSYAWLSGGRFPEITFFSVDPLLPLCAAPSAALSG